MKLTYFKGLGVTLAFFMPAAVFAACVWALAATGQLSVQGSSNWTEQAALLVGYAVIAGLMVDACRLALSALWRRLLSPRSRRERYDSRTYA